MQCSILHSQSHYTVADPEGGPWGPLTPPFEVNFKRLNDTS